MAEASTIPGGEPRRYRVHARQDDPRRSHLVEGRSFEEAAVAFVERWSPPVDAAGAVSVLVADEHGVELCYRVDLDEGDARPCG